MNNINPLFRTITILLLIIQFSCNKDSTEPMPPPGSSLTVTGDISESYEVVAYFGTATYSSPPDGKKYFTIFLVPKSQGNNKLAMTLLYKSGSESPVVDTFSIGEYAFGEEIPVHEFGSSFSSRNVTDLSGYVMTSGMLNISESSASRVSGDFEMSGYFVQIFERDSSRVVNIAAKFQAIPAPEQSVIPTSVSGQNGIQNHPVID